MRPGPIRMGFTDPAFVVAAWTADLINVWGLPAELEADDRAERRACPRRHDCRAPHVQDQDLYLATRGDDAFGRPDRQVQGRR